MNGTFFIDFNLVACDFLKFDWCKMSNGYVDFSLSILAIIKLQIDIKWSSFLAEYRSQLNLRSVAVRPVGFICSCSMFQI